MEELAVIVTGAARGMGLSHAEALAGTGARVLLTDLIEDLGRRETGRLREDGLAVEFAPLDVTDPDQWRRAVELAESSFGLVNGLVNNAGMAPQATIAEETLERWNQTVAVNATGCFLGTQAVIEPMRRSGGGAIVNIASVAGLRGSPAYAAYCASKAAVVSLTRTSALALAGDGVRVNSICPGAIQTPMTADGPTRVLERTPLGRRGVASEVSEAVLYLISARSSYVTGTELVVDGGFLAT